MWYCRKVQMAPPTPVISRSQVRDAYRMEACTLKELVQNECTFQVTGGEVRSVCLPFKRLFNRCLVTYLDNGKKAERYINIEVTGPKTNERILTEREDEVRRFWAADLESRKWLAE